MRAICSRVLVAAGPKVKPCMNSVLQRMEHQKEDIRIAAIECCRSLSFIIDKFARSQGRIFLEDMVSEDQEELVQKKLRAIRVLAGAGKNADPYLEEVIQELESNDWRLR